MVSHTKGGSKKDGPTQGPLNIAGRCPAQGGEAGGQGRYGRAQLSTEPAEAPGGGTEPERMTGQGREAAPAGWRGPQRSEDSGLLGRTLDAAGVAHAPGCAGGCRPNGRKASSGAAQRRAPVLTWLKAACAELAPTTSTRCFTHRATGGGIEPENGTSFHPPTRLSP